MNHRAQAGSLQALARRYVRMLLATHVLFAQNGEKLVRLGVTHGPKSLQRGRSLTVNCRRALDHKVSRFHGVDDVGRAGCHDEPAARVGGGADDLPH